MYQVSDHTRSQFEKMLGLASVKEALAFIEANQPEAIEEQKELVLIVARTLEKNRIMKAIMDGAGPKAGAIVFSLPVTDTAGLRLLEDEEPVQETSAQ